MVRRNFIKGHFNQIEGTLHRKVGQLVRYHGPVYIGATSRPRSREQAHKRNGWVERPEIILLWKTTSYARAAEAEDRLINWARSREHLRYDDQRDGGAGLSRDASVYYVYALV